MPAPAQVAAGAALSSWIRSSSLACDIGITRLAIRFDATQRFPRSRRVHPPTDVAAPLRAHPASPGGAVVFSRAAKSPRSMSRSPLESRTCPGFMHLRMCP